MQPKKSIEGKLRFTIKCSSGKEAFIDEDTFIKIIKSCYYQSKGAYRVLKPFYDECMENEN